MTICQLFSLVRSRFFEKKSTQNNGKSSSVANNNNEDDVGEDITRTFRGSESNLSTASDSMVPNGAKHQLPSRYYSVDVNQRRRRNCLNLNFSPSLRKSLIIDELEKSGSPVFGDSSSSQSLSNRSYHQYLSEITPAGTVSRHNSTITIGNRRYQNVLESDFRKISDLGHGTFGSVQRCLHLTSGHSLAIKRIKVKETGPDGPRHFAKELQLLAKTNHQHIVTFYGFVITEHDHELWLCMELMDASFDRLIARHGPIPEPVIGAVTLSMVRALDYLKQNHNVIHRDVKPSNILVNQDGVVKLCDFGISGQLVDSRTSSQTMGSVAYQAPERIQPSFGDPPYYDSRIDVWSLGLSLLEMALGRFPYQDWCGVFGIITKIMNPDEVPKLTGRYSAKLKRFIDACLQHDYRHRPKYHQLRQMPFYREQERTLDVRSTTGVWFERLLVE